MSVLYAAVYENIPKCISLRCYLFMFVSLGQESCTAGTIISLTNLPVSLHANENYVYTQT